MKPFTELNVGFANAENYRKRENKQLLSKFFVRDEFLERLLDRNVYYLVGEKGTGKTAYSTYLRNNEYRNHRSFAYDVRQTEYQKFMELKGLGHLPLSQYSEVWISILLILCSISILEGSGTPDFLKRFTRMRGLKLAIDEFYSDAFSPEIVKVLNFVQSSELSTSLLAKHFPVEASGKTHAKSERQDSNATFQTNLLKIRQAFEAALTAVSLDRDYVIFIDGIDVRPANIEYENYFECVQGLIEAVWSINNDFLSNIKDSKGRIRIVLLVRPDIFLRAGLHNINTKIRDNSVFLNWSTTYKDFRTSSLYKVADRLLSAQQDTPNNLTPGSAWNFYFPFHAENVRAVEVTRDGDVNSFLAFLRFSYYRPRDINAMIGTLKEILGRRGTVDYVKVADFNDPSFRDAHADYLLGEIRDQLLFYYSQAEYDLFLEFFSHLNGHKRFSYKRFISSFNSFVTDCSSSGRTLPQFFGSADVFLQFLYEQNVICYIEKDDENEDGERFIRWCFRERTPSNLAPKVRTNVEYEVFYGLTKALNVGRPIRIKREHLKREIGTIINIIKDKGFGFLRGGAKQADYYVKLEEFEFDSPKIGEKVSFEVKIKYGKMRAESVRRSR